jgi:hAT family C-terminal dimerisation region
LEKIEKDKADVVSFIYQLLQETVVCKLEALVEESKEQEQTVFQQLDIDDDDELGGDVITQLLRKENESRRLNIDEGEKRIELEECLKGDIKKELEHFMSYCSTTPLDGLLRNHPTEYFSKELLQEEKDKELNIPRPKVNRGMPSYAAPRFDVLHWWQHVGKLLYPKLAIGAPIILGKPAHNGFQERVFSIGKYCDNTLRNRMRPENFEMRVLDTVNKLGDGIDFPKYI